MKFKFGFLGLGFLIGLALALAGWQLLSPPYTYQGSIISPPIPAADFTLTDQEGAPYRLSDRRGRLILIFFGYTNCPDVCPVTLAQFKQIKESLGEQASGVEFVFVTVDPQRDSQEVVGRYLDKFDSEFIGLSGAEEDLRKVWEPYGVYQAKQETGSAAGYLVDHTARVYVIDQAGYWRMTYPFGMETEKMYQDIVHLLRERRP